MIYMKFKKSYLVLQFFFLPTKIYSSNKRKNCRIFTDFCDKTFYKKSNLRVHMMIHENIKPYKCFYCDQHFAQKSTRDVHSIKHTGRFSVNNHNGI